MLQLRQEVLAYTRACEHLLSRDMTLTEDERSLLEYYLQELSQKFFHAPSRVGLCGGQKPGLEPSVKL